MAGSIGLIKLHQRTFYMKQNIKLSSPDREIYLYMKEDQHQKEVVKAEPSYDDTLHCSVVLFCSRYWPLGPRMPTLYSPLENINTK